ncbi:hypothetical protein AB0284_21590 [Pseudarthrobacter phenanthrenivorans]|uniref:hypothetical protein n=1 Tax=Pseudarthrobacter phenanthrenivorans TaxID=361575 RepID=UPI00344F02D6
MAYAFESQLVIDPITGAKAANASVTVYDANDTANSTPLALTDMNGTVLQNPLTSTADAFIPPFMADVYKVKLVGGGLVVVAWSGEGLVTEAKAAKDAATAVANFKADKEDLDNYTPANPALTVNYNPDGSVASTTEDGITTNYTYNADGTVATITRNGVTRTLSYANGNVTGAA